MKRIVLILTLSIFIMMAASATEPTNPTVRLDAKLDLTNEDHVEFYFADSTNSTIETLSLKSSSNDTLSGTGSFYIKWDVISSTPFVLKIYSGAMTNSNKDELHWTLKKGSEIVFDKSSNYGGTSNIIYTHDPNDAIGKNGSVQFNVTTDDVSNLSNSVYSATLKVMLKSKL